MKVNRINSAQFDNWKPRDAREELNDGDGLRARKGADGVVRWSLMMRLDGQMRRFRVGDGLGLKEAREEAKQLRQRVRSGEDPTKARRERRARAADAATGIGTVAAVIDAYFETGDGRHLRTKKMQRTMARAVFKSVLPRPAMDLRLAELQKAANGYKAASSAARAVVYIRPILRWAVSTEEMNLDADKLAAPIAPEAEQRVLTEEEAGALLRAMGDDAHARAVRWMLMTGCRCNEACRAKWGEVDLEGARWTIPGARRKDTRRARVKAAAGAAPDHIAPLPRQAVEFLRTLGPGDAGGLVFPGPRGAVLSNWQRWCRGVEKRLQFTFTVHSLRRTTATLAGDLGAEPHIIKSVLGHRRVADALTARYAKSRYENETREALQRVADRLDLLERNESNVVVLRRA